MNLCEITNFKLRRIELVVFILMLAALISITALCIHSIERPFSKASITVFTAGKCVDLTVMTPLGKPLGSVIVVMNPELTIWDYGQQMKILARLGLRVITVDANNLVLPGFLDALQLRLISVDEEKLDQLTNPSWLIDEPCYDRFLCDAITESSMGLSSSLIFVLPHDDRIMEAGARLRTPQRQHWLPMNVVKSTVIDIVWVDSLDSIKYLSRQKYSEFSDVITWPVRHRGSTFVFRRELLMRRIGESILNYFNKPMPPPGNGFPNYIPHLRITILSYGVLLLAVSFAYFAFCEIFYHKSGRKLLSIFAFGWSSIMLLLYGISNGHESTQGMMYPAGLLNGIGGGNERSRLTLSNYGDMCSAVRYRFYDNISSEIYEKYICDSVDLSPVDGEYLAFRQRLLLYCGDAISGRKDVYTSSKLCADLLRLSISVELLGSGEGGVETILERGSISVDRFRLLHVAAMRAVGIASRIDTNNVVEIFTGIEWVAAPVSPFSCMEDIVFPLKRTN